MNSKKSLYYVLSTTSDTYYFLNKNEILFLSLFFFENRKIIFTCSDRREKTSPALQHLVRQRFSEDTINLKKAVGKI